jgi:hypothetical protein
MSASKLLLLGLGGLSTLLSFSARLKISFLFSFSPSEGVAPPPPGPQVGSVHKPAQLIWAPCLPYWHGCLYWHDLSKTCQNVGAWQNVGARWHFGPFSENFSPAFRGRLLGSYHSDQRAVKSKNAPFGLLFQISPLGTLWACPERLHVNKKAGQPPFPRPKKSISAPRGPTIPLQVCICSQKLSESSSITFKSLNRGLLAF